MTQANPIEITFHGLPATDALQEAARAQVEHLQTFCDRIHGCRVVFEPDRRRHHTGNRYRVKVHVHVPGAELVVGEHATKPGHEDPMLALSDAFRAMGRKVQDYARRRQGQVKDHFDPEERARVTRLLPGQDCGFVETFSGRELYFHRNALVDADLDELSVGAEVRVVEAEGEGREGPQASTVKVKTSQR